MISTVLDGKYRIEKKIGQGGMGAVYLATHLGTDRLVALKVIVSKYATDPVHVERFRREARAAGRLRHPNVVDVTDFGIAEAAGKTVAYLVMEYLDGCSLAEVMLEDPKLPLDWTIDLLDQLCLAVAELHDRGIVHRDLKPSNVWLEPNLRGGVTVKLLDFGLAKLDDPAPAPAIAVRALTDRGGGDSDDCLEDDTVLDADVSEALTRAGSVFGTPGYMSPEQCEGLPAGPASDIYSLGVIAYQMLSGVPPFSAQGRELMALHLTEIPEPLHDRAPDVPSGVSAVVMRALEKSPGRRPATARRFAEALRAKSESPGATLRRGLVFALDRFPVFFQLVGRLLIPFYVVVLFELVIALLAVGDRRLQGVSEALSPVFAIAETVFLLLAGVVARGVGVLVVAQLLLAPFKRTRISLALSTLRRLWAPVLEGALVWTALVVAPFLLAVELGRAGLLVFRGLRLRYGICGRRRRAGLFLVGPHD
jgi:serine/threonine protein kinase